MAKWLLKMILHGANVLRFFLVRPLVLVLKLLLCLKLGKSGLVKRLSSELEYSKTPSGYFDYVFHVSSEGEWQQAIPLVLKALDQNKEVLVLYSSESLVETMTQWGVRNTRLSSSMVPLLCYKASFYKGFGFKKFYMVRYDFYPELLLLSFRAPTTLLAATLKNKKTNRFKEVFWRAIFSRFETILTSTEEDKERISFLLGSKIHNVECLDFRHGQIIRRQAEFQKAPKHQDIFKIQSWVQEVPKSRTLILGSVWGYEIEIIVKMITKLAQQGAYRVLLAPHKLSGREYEEFENLLFSSFNNIQVEAGQGEKLSSSIVICKVPGILCELYPFFFYAYVGGGFGRSVHSLLEPFWAECRVCCGPQIHRSTEYEYIIEKNPSYLKVLTSQSISDEFFHFESGSFFDYDQEKEHLLQLNIGQYL